MPFERDPASTDAFHLGDAPGGAFMPHRQLDLPGFGVPQHPLRLDDPPRGDARPLAYSLFLGIVPDPPDADRISHLASELRRRHGFTEAPLPAPRLHVTLHKLGGFVAEVPEAVVDAAIAAGGATCCQPFQIAFDRILTFEGSGAFVLRCDERSDTAISRLRNPLGAALRRFSLKPIASRTPHMTMLYGRRRRIPECKIQPMQWTASRFVLVLSHVGCGRHQWIRTWPLG